MPTELSPELKANIVKVLAASQKPMAPAAILKALPVGGRPKAKALAEFLAQMESDGLLISVPHQSGKYANGPIDTWIRNAIMAAMSAAPQTEAKLLKVVTTSNAALLKVMLASLKKEGRIHEHPPLTKAGKPLFGLRQPDPIAYVGKDVDKLIAAAVGKGFPKAAIRHALIRYLSDQPSPPAAVTIPSDAIIAAMRRLEPRVEDGAAVPIGKLRKSLAQDFGKDAFDMAIIQLASSGILELQSHAWPERLTDAERDALISNGRGGWFDSAALRQRATP